VDDAADFTDRCSRRVSAKATEGSMLEEFDELDLVIRDNARAPSGRLRLTAPLPGASRRRRLRPQWQPSLNSCHPAAARA
jgi:hypothetical protein